MQRMSSIWKIGNKIKLGRYKHERFAQTQHLWTNFYPGDVLIKKL
jgi:hypothetical protein